MQRTLRLLFAAVVVVVVGLALARVAHAQPAPASPPARGASAKPAAAPASAPAGAPAAAPDPQRLADAKMHFLRGVDHVDHGEWDAALSEFLKSREILPTARNTYNAAVCLRRVNRFDESLDMYETFLRDFPNADDKAVAQQELAQLKTSVGAIELRGGTKGAAVMIDGRERGTLPLAAPLRVGAGTHAVRVSSEGTVPFETRANVVGMQTVVVEVRLAVLTSGGRLKVAEQTGKALDVVVDNAVAGKTPWDGVLPPGDHAVVLRGEGLLGTQPVLAAVKLNQTLTLNLLAEDLEGKVRVVPTPATARVSIDTIPVGVGAWEGRLRAGAHTVDVTADGYLPITREVTLKADEPSAVEIALVRDPKAFGGPSASLGIEIDVAGALGAIYGGDLATSCAGSCSASMPLGGRGVLHGIYQSGSGFGAGLDVGYLIAFRTLSGRDDAIQPLNLAPNTGTVEDSLRLSGLTAGASALYRASGTWPLVVRLGAGVLLGSVRDDRSGEFQNSKAERYPVSTSRSDSATYVYIAPELRLGRRIGEHLELSVGAEILLMTALKQPKWDGSQQVVTTNDPMSSGDGLGTFASDALVGSFLVFVAPGVGARYDF